MKKKLAYVLMIVFAISAFTGCKGKKTDNTENTAGDNEISSDNNVTDDGAQDPADEIEDSGDDSEDAAEENKENDSEDDSEDAAGENKENDSKDDTEDTENGNTQDTADSGLSSMIKEIYEVKNPGLMVADIPVDLNNSDSVKYYTGLSDASKIKEAVASEAMIGSQAYSLVLVQLNDEKDAETVADEMLKGIDTRKWICVEADDLRVVGHDDVIMLFMVSSALKENVTSKQMVDAFKEVCDGELDIELKK